MFSVGVDFCRAFQYLGEAARKRSATHGCAKPFDGCGLEFREARIR
jgi:hypothetical protein